MSKKFTTENAIKIQTEQLEGWRKLLKKSVFEDLKAWATENNSFKMDGTDVIRGSDLDNYVANYIHNKKRGLKPSN